MRRKAFTLIELAIALTIVGLMIGGSFQAVKAMRERNKTTEAKDNVNAAKDAVIGYNMEYINLPTVANFDENLSPIKNSKLPLFYFPSPNLTKNIDICSANTTDLNVSLYDDTTLKRTIENVAFVVASRSANNNLQTNISSGIVKVYKPYNKIDDNSNDFPRVEEYDDIVKWVTLVELQRYVRCDDKPLRFVNNRLPDTNTTLAYDVAIVIDGNYSATTEDNCTINPPYDGYFTYNPAPDYNITSSATRPSGVAVVNCTFKVDGKKIDKKFVITIDP